MLDNQWHKKENPLLSLLGMGGGGGGNLTSKIAGDTPLGPHNGIQASGGTTHSFTDPGPGYQWGVHVFTSPGTFLVTQASSIPTLPSNIDYLVVAGGGGGGARGGAGGAGGLRSTFDQTGGGGSLESQVPVNHPTAKAYNVTVGAGGNGSTSVSSEGSPGYDSVLEYLGGTITSEGGGGGCSDNTPTGENGGSGGGGGNNKPGGTGAGGQGYPGADAQGDGNGGGGGAGGAAPTGPMSPTQGGDAGAGVQNLIAGPNTASPVGTPGPSGSTGWFASGGAGSHGYNGPPGSTKPGGGGAAGTGPTYSPDPNRLATAGTDNTGGGGGAGGGVPSPNFQGGNGGPGIIVVRYRIAPL